MAAAAMVVTAVATVVREAGKILFLFARNLEEELAHAL